MTTAKKKVTLELNQETMRRLADAASLKGLSVDEYCRENLELLLSLEDNLDDTDEDATRRLLAVLRLQRPLYRRLFPEVKDAPLSEYLRLNRGHIDAFNDLQGDVLNDYREWELKRRLGEHSEEYFKW